MTRQHQLLTMALGEFLRNLPTRDIDDTLCALEEYFGASSAKCSSEGIDVVAATRLGTLKLDGPVTFNAPADILPEYLARACGPGFHVDDDLDADPNLDRKSVV